MYSAVKSEDTEALVASDQDCLNRWVLRCRLKVSTVWQDLMSDGSEFQVRVATTENAWRASSLHILLGQSAAGRRMTAEDELEQPSGSGRSSTLACCGRHCLERQ